MKGASYQVVKEDFKGHCYHPTEQCLSAEQKHTLGALDWPRIEEAINMFDPNIFIDANRQQTAFQETQMRVLNQLIGCILWEASSSYGWM